MLAALDCALMPARTELASIHGRIVAVADGQRFRIDLIPDNCSVDEAHNRVTLAVALGDNKCSVWMKRRAYWDVEQVTRLLECVFVNGNLASDEPVCLDDYRDSN